jgi:hypothetical protein
LASRRDGDHQQDRDRDDLDEHPIERVDDGHPVGGPPHVRQDERHREEPRHDGAER